MKKDDLLIITGMGALVGAYGALVRASAATGAATLLLLEDKGAFKKGDTVSISAGEWLYVEAAPFRWPRSPLLANYFTTKAACSSQAILLIKMGDFYEVLGPDAAQVSAATKLALTKRSGVQMCGFPCHAICTYALNIATATNRPIYIQEGTILEQWGISEELTPENIRKDAESAAKAIHNKDWSLHAHISRRYAFGTHKRAQFDAAVKRAASEYRQ